MTEADWQSTVTDYARLCGWRICHFRPARAGKGWATPVQYDGVGFPDLVLVRGARLVFVELKAARGRVTDEQMAWLDALAAAGAETWVWRPDDFDTVVEVLG